jgi:hypothetical protein
MWANPASRARVVEIVSRTLGCRLQPTTATRWPAIFADERLCITGGEPGTVESLRSALGRLAADRATDTAAQLNWVIRRLVDGVAVGMLQAIFSRGGQATEISWLVGHPMAGQGFASEAAIAVAAY